MHIAFITDLHIGAENVKPFGIDVRRHFELVLHEIKNHRPDMIILGGDLCFEHADKEIYRYIKSQLDTADISYNILSGNHDNAADIAEAFQLSLWNNQLVKRTRLGGVELFFLDSTSAEIPQVQLDWLQKELEECEAAVFVFVHHPPLKAGTPYMDTKWPLKNGAALEQVLLDFGKQVFVFSGHYHIEKTTVRKNITQFISPSCFMQIDQYAKEFKADHSVPSWRMIVWENNTLQTTVHYVMERELADD